jgi:phosphoglycolate phosphatase-like HAD superfamily hydrolase
VLASSAKQDEVEHYLDQLETRELADGWTTSTDVDATKPAADLVNVAPELIGGGPEDAVMVGDTPWGVESDSRAVVATVTVRPGRVGADEVREAGAIAIFESVQELRERLDETPLA